MLQVGCSCRIKGVAWDVGLRVLGPHGLRFRFRIRMIIVIWSVWDARLVEGRECDLVM